MNINFRNKIARFIVETDYQGLPEQVVHATKRCLLDFIGVALASGKTDLISFTCELVSNMGEAPESTVIGEGFKLPVLNAAFINGIKGHSLDMDDGNRFGAVHPAVVIFPAALALAQKQDIKGKDFIASIVAGYETLIYLAKNMNPSHLQRGFHTTASLGAFGAAAACSRILGLTIEETENALSIAGLCGSGLLEVLTSGQVMKPFQTARAAQAGLMAALMAKEGFKGSELIFEGEKGFFRAYADTDIKLEGFSGLGSKFEIMNMYFKKYSACRHIHSALDGVYEIMQKHPVVPESITGIEVETYTIAFNLTGHRATEISETAAKFSTPVSLALMMVFGTLERSVFTEENISDPRVQELADKVVVRIDPKRDAVYPEQRGAKIIIKSHDGSDEIEVNVPKGEPENPLTDNELMEKFYENAGELFSKEKTQKITAAVFGLENINAANLVEMLGRI